MLPLECFPIATSRLILRRFEEADWHTFLMYRNDPEIARYQGWSNISPETAQNFVREMNLAEFGVAGRWFQIALALPSTDELIGDIGVHFHADDIHQAEIGYTICRAHQGRGLATEAVRATIDLLFQKTPVTDLTAITDTRNGSSIKVLVKLGFQLVQTDTAYFNDEPCQEHTFQLNQRQWVK
ncbi:MAG: GNAT family N-acetyltransferase [Acidobacteria bacterium]|nr:GNAT family N-acetyltransferase [Acidobacteriota bacterium]